MGSLLWARVTFYLYEPIKPFVINLVNDSIKLFLPLPKNFNNSIDGETPSSIVVIKTAPSQEEQDEVSTKKNAEETLTQRQNSIPQASGYIKYPAYDFF